MKMPCPDDAVIADRVALVRGLRGVSDSVIDDPAELAAYASDGTHWPRR